MKAAPYGNYSNIEFQDTSGTRDGVTHMNPQRYHRFPTGPPILHSADVDSDRTSDRSSMEKKVLYRIGNPNISLPLNGNENPSQGTSPEPDWRRRNDETEGHMRNRRRNGEGFGYPKSHHQEGPSNYISGSSNIRFGESPRHFNEYDVPKTFGILERDRAELLRKLSELEKQLVQSGSGGELGNQRHLVGRSKYHHESFGSPGDRHQDNYSISSSASKMADKHVTCFSPYRDKHLYTESERHIITARDSYNSSGSSNDIQRYEDYSDSQIPWRGTMSTPGHFQEYSSYPRKFPVQSADAADPRIPDSPLHQLDCSCFHCYNNNLNSPILVQSRSPKNTRYTDISSNPKFYHQRGAQKGYDSQNSNSSLAMGGRINHNRWPNESVSTVDELARGYSQSKAPVNVKRSFRPIAGCSPFFICSNCFELLQLRWEIIKFGNPHRKIQCGVCSSITYCVVEGKKLVFSIHKKQMEKSKELTCGSYMDEARENNEDFENASYEVVEEMLHTRGPSQTSKSFQSDELCFSDHDEGICDLEHSSNISVIETKDDPVQLEPILVEAVEEILSNQCPKNEDDKSFQSNNLTRLRDESPLMNKAPAYALISNKSPDADSLLSADNSDELIGLRDESPLMDKAPAYASISNKSLDAHCLLSAGDLEDDPEECATADDVSDELEHHGYSPSKHAVYWFGSHSQIRRAIYEEKNQRESAPSINLVSDIPAVNEIETETEVPHSGTPTINIHSDTKGGSHTEDPPCINNGGFFAENIKDTDLNLAKSIQRVEDPKCKVTINGHPIADHLVRKAESLAGPILPGNYWYDSQAGFWGVIGGPCLGIILPEIKQFDYPISKNCSGGTTGVIVNGRELHEKDLALLHSRGLPIQRGKSYILEITGRVTDKDSGEELGSLGPLAPTIERLKRGFGMRAFRQQLPVDT